MAENVRTAITMMSLFIHHSSKASCVGSQQLASSASEEIYDTEYIS
jgi:hypothetical protein